MLIEQDVVSAVPRGVWIGGEWLQTGATLPVEDPSTGEVLTEIADASAEDALAALDAACAVQEEWAAWAPRERGEILRRSYEELMARQDELALLMTLEMGKPLGESRGEIAYAADFFRWFAEESVRIDGRFATAPNGAGRLLVMKQPVGPCLLITPWNFPMAMGTRKIGPAVAAGCTMIVKPAQQTPLSMLALAEILERAGLPAGVLNIVTSSSASRVVGPLMNDPRAAQGLLHRLDRGGEDARRAVRAPVAAGLDGARRQRAVPRLRGRRPRRRRRRRDAGQDAQRRRGLHRRQPLPRARGRRGGVRRAPGAAHGRIERRPGHRAGDRRRPADQPRRARQGRRAGEQRARPGGDARSSAASRSTAPAPSTSRPCSPTSPTTRGC